MQFCMLFPYNYFICCYMERLVFLEYALFIFNELPVTQICVLLPGDYFGNCGFAFTQLLQRHYVIFK